MRRNPINEHFAVKGRDGIVRESAMVTNAFDAIVSAYEQGAITDKRMNTLLKQLAAARTAAQLTKVRKAVAALGGVKANRRRNPTYAAWNQASGVVDALDASSKAIVKALERLTKLEDELEAEALKPTAKMRELRSTLTALGLKVTSAENAAGKVEREVYRMAGGD